MVSSKYKRCVYVMKQTIFKLYIWRNMAKCLRAFVTNKTTRFHFRMGSKHLSMSMLQQKFGQLHLNKGMEFWWTNNFKLLDRRKIFCYAVKMLNVAKLSFSHFLQTWIAEYLFFISQLPFLFFLIIYQLCLQSNGFTKIWLWTHK